MTLRSIAYLALLIVASYGAYRWYASDGAVRSDRSIAAPSSVRRGNGGDPQTLDPARAEDVHSFNVLTDLYEGLLAIDAHGRIVPGVASSWEVSDDGLVHTFHLRGDARWSDGAPVVAADFVDAMRRTLSPETGSAYAFLLFPIRNAEAVSLGESSPEALGVAARDDTTLVIELHSPASYFHSVLTMPIAFPRHSDVRDYSDPESFVGNGPFVLAEWLPGSVVRLLRNPRFHAAETVAIDEVRYFAVPDLIAELNMYLAGEIDVTQSVPGSHVAKLLERRTEELRIAPSLGLYYLAFDLGEPPFDSAPLRKALSMAVDREKLVRVIGRGEQPAYGLVPDSVSGYEPARFDWRDLTRDERLQRARELYAQAGYSPARPLRTTLMYDTGDIHETIALAVAGMWRDALGVDVEFDKREWKYFLATRSNRDDWQVMRFTWTGDFDHPAAFTSILRSDSPQNLSGYASARYDALMENAEAARDPREQMSLHRQAEAVMLEDDPIVPLYFYVSKHLVSPRISGFEANGLDRHPSRYLRRSAGTGTP